MKIYFRISGILAILGALLRSVAYIASFDSEIGYFNSGFLPIAANLLIVLACLFAGSGFVFINKNATLPRSLDSSPNPVFFASVFAGFIMAADFVYKVFVMIGSDRFEYYAFIFKRGFRAENAYLLRATAVIEIFGAFSSLIAAAWFFLRSAKKQRKTLCAVLGFFPILRALSGIATVYFDMTVQMNHPSKLFLQLTLIAVMMYFLCEERFLVSEKHPRPRRYFVSGCAAFILALSCGVSEMIGFFFGMLEKGAFCVEAFFCLTVGIYIFVRVRSFVADAQVIPVLGETEVSAETEQG